MAIVLGMILGSGLFIVIQDAFAITEYKLYGIEIQCICPETIIMPTPIMEKNESTRFNW